jgi:hypothetical protein
MHSVRLGSTALKLQQREVRKENEVNKGKNKREKIKGWKELKGENIL